MPPSRLKKKKAQEKVIPWKLLIYLVTLLLAAGLWIWIASDHSLEGTSFLRDNSKQPSPFDMFEVTGDRKADDETEHESEDKSSSPHFDLHQLLQSRTSHGLNETIEVFEDVSKMLREHPLKGVYRSIARDSRVEDVLYSLQQTKQCFGHPIIISMARVGSQLYWQLIENYIYTLVKFEMVHCAIMVCVNDVECMRMCADADFPCYNFEYKHLELSNNLNNLKGESTEISSMEQIAHLKLLHLPKALKRGVDIFVLDLDVGFTASPKELLEKFKKSDKDVMVQKDITFIMHRSKELWKTWFTEAMPNIGIMACKGNEKTFKMFQYAWNEYLTTDTSIRKNPGKDQNKVAGALSYAKKTYNLKWNYFPDSSTMLLDKVFKFDDNRIELGGAMSEKILKKKSTVAAHTTCYEQNAKMKGLKAANAFWNPYFYHPRRRTLTKKLVFSGASNLKAELQVLFYLAALTNRSLIIPNLLGSEKLKVIKHYNELSLWPGFRVAKVTPNDVFDVEVLEPGYYFRVERDYLQPNQRLPDPYVVALTTIKKKDTEITLRKIIQKLLLPGTVKQPRVVLDLSFGIQHESDDVHEVVSRDDLRARMWLRTRVQQWARDSVGDFHSYMTEKERYIPLPYFSETDKTILESDPLQIAVRKNIRACASVFMEQRGNRSCFDKCK